MLVEIMCDEFKDHGTPRGRIQLHAGLNTVMGSSSGSNSIGKSTFLMIIDFVFGGDDYVEKLTDVQTEVGEHRICFAFQFKDGVHYFSRSNVDYKNVQKCDKETNSQDTTNVDPITQKWWDSMVDIMEVNPDNSPVSIPLEELFHMD